MFPTYWFMKFGAFNQYSENFMKFHEFHEISWNSFPTDCFMKFEALINLPYKLIIGFMNFHELQVKKIQLIGSLCELIL